MQFWPAMKIKLTYLPLILLAVIPFTGHTADRKKVSETVGQYIRRYPEAQLQDIYKSFFHDTFGPGHLIPSREKAENYFNSELAQMPDDTVDCYFEPAGCGENFYHVDMRAVRDGYITREELFNAFYDSLLGFQMPDVDFWKDNWHEILDVIGQTEITLPDAASDAARIDSVLATGNYAMHHSQRFNSAYSPHYRLVSVEIFNSRLRDKLPAPTSH